MRQSWLQQSWLQWSAAILVAGVLLMTGLFATGCGEKKSEDIISGGPTEQSGRPSEQVPPSMLGQTRPEEGAKGLEPVPPDATEKEKAKREQPPGRG
jgi:hypothetical protein